MALRQMIHMQRNADAALKASAGAEHFGQQDALSTRLLRVAGTAVTAATVLVAGLAAGAAVRASAAVGMDGCTGRGARGERYAWRSVLLHAGQPPGINLWLVQDMTTAMPGVQRKTPAASTQGTAGG